jgi:concanavalin A-like lectin/glucanase superfamily protein
MAVRFDASGDALSRTTNVPSRTACTMMGWVNLAVDRNSNSDAMALRQSGGTSNIFTIQTDVDGTSIQQFVASTQGATFGTYVVGQWMFVAITGNATPQAISYCRAASATSLSTSAAIATASVTAAMISFGDRFPAGGEFINGYMAVLKVFDAALTSTEILAESFTVQPVRQTNINSWFPLTSITQAADQSGNARNLTVGGTVTWDDQMPPIVNSVFPRKSLPQQHLLVR